MKMLILLFVSLNGFASSIFLGPKDQAQLEKLLRGIPEAHTKNEDKTGFHQKTYTYPVVKSPFQISCIADHEKSAPEPSKVLCSMKLVKGAENGINVVKANDEYVVTLNDSATVANLQKALKKKKLISLEHLKFKNRLGVDKEQPRFVLSCGRRTCKLTFASKEPETP